MSEKDVRSPADAAGQTGRAHRSGKLVCGVLILKAAACIFAIFGGAIEVIRADTWPDGPPFRLASPTLQAALPLHEVQFLEYSATASATPTCIVPLHDLEGVPGRASATAVPPRGQALPDVDDADPEPLPIPPVPPLLGLRRS